MTKKTHSADVDLTIHAPGSLKDLFHLIYCRCIYILKSLQGLSGAGFALRLGRPFEEEIPLAVCWTELGLIYAIYKEEKRCK